MSRPLLLCALLLGATECFAQLSDTLVLFYNPDEFLLAKDAIRFYLPKVKNCELVLRVNKDRYRVVPEKEKSEFVYLKRKEETITVDITVTDRRGRYTQYRQQALATIPYDEAAGHYVIDEKFLKQLEQDHHLSLKRPSTGLLPVWNK